MNSRLALTIGLALLPLAGCMVGPNYKTPAAAAHVKVGDRVLRVAGHPVTPKNLPATIRATRRAPIFQSKIMLPHCPLR